eukprot:CAMPEP_0195117478 /NCGR_PEP_ID=MMETSP0448-20130528/114457_1 /TAXON_ID=66468 /ORGANISM="Heterocapsa triquestra, Strain CCMP 448" /LENGTH=77 /DNA_ID=CAMNT_0040154697 /DNA_START=55 /DNA_END=285 /DNA_ORIENTATION=-
MARARSSLLSLLAAAAAVCLVAQWLSMPFVPAPAARDTTVAPVVGAAATTLLASLPAEAYSFKGPLTGSEVCTSKPL